MSLPHPKEVLKLFERLTTDDRLCETLPSPGKAFSRRRVYTLGVVVRLMMLQHLMPNGTLSEVLQQWLESKDGGEQTPGISANAGAYCRARLKLPTLVAVQIFEMIVERLRGWLPANPLLPGRPVYVLDGSTLSLPHTSDLVKRYPPPRNQYGDSHWPILRLVVLQDVQTGLALCPRWGPHHGSKAVSEQELALQAIPDLPAQAVVLGDRNFGVFVIAWAAAQAKRDVLLRLTDQRATALAGGPLNGPSRQRVCWKPTRFDRVGGPFPDDAGVDGWLLCIQAELSTEYKWLYFFTTLDLPPETLAALYRLRWNVETDLRSIKQTTRLQHIAVRSSDLLEKDLLLALAAYNLVRAVICLAAERAKTEPRRMSFTNIYTLVETFLPDILTARTARQWNDCWDRILSLAKTYKLPNRSKPRSFPRAVWRRPTHHSRT